MTSATAKPVLADLVGPNLPAAIWAKRALLIIVGVIALIASAKVAIPVPGSPVPVTLGTFTVLSIGTAYGARLGLVTLLAYMALGATGMDIFATSDPTNPAKIGLAYFMGGTGGYLLGYVLAATLVGALASRGWDRSVPKMVLGMLLANLVIYVPGLLWLHQFTTGWAQTLQWGITPYLIGDALKLALAALLFPTLWKLVGKARL